MGNLSDIVLRTSYHKGRDDIAQQFYLPCMRSATEYDRAVGFFRSTVFVIAWPALREFVERGGRIRILCSQILADEDIEAIGRGYSARVDDALAAHFVEEVRSLLHDDALNKPARILAALVADGILDVKIAVLRRSDVALASGRIFHDKLGIFRDGRDNTVIFKGSMNETWTGLAADGNLESVDVACSWMGARDLDRVRSEEGYFRQLWTDRYPTLTVRPFPEVARHEFKIAADKDWQSTVERLERKELGAHVRDVRRTLFPHQAAGLASWKANDRQGILAFATGSGKTFTAITAMREAITSRHEVAVIVVPDQVLFEQWYKELLKTTQDIQPKILRCGAGNNSWRSNLALWTTPGDSYRIILATVQTAATDGFRERLYGGPHLLLVADEVHKLGSHKNQRLLDNRLFGARLGLSATPERAGDPGGTLKILSFFGGILEPRYTLNDAVRDHVLTPYFYRPHVVRLTDHEGKCWDALTADIGRTHGKIARGDKSESLAVRIQRLRIRRARIVKSAMEKAELAVQVLKAEFVAGQRWIVYCDDLRQLNVVSRDLLRSGIDNMPFHSRMEGDRGETLKWLDRRGGVVIAIKCLDEGIDVPSITHALILASSKNPREFVQRRGRVLRNAPNKFLAYIHDAIVLPPGANSEEESDTDRDRESIEKDIEGDAITLGELARAVEFAQNAANPAAAADLQLIAVEMGIDWQKLAGTGIEDED